jgi:hypothetical protein
MRWASLRNAGYSVTARMTAHTINERNGENTS